MRKGLFVFLGPSGAGKSTTQKIITGILKDYQGSVKVNNQEIFTTKNEFFAGLFKINANQQTICLNWWDSKMSLINR
ncbi:ATP-binding cassette domain-containing protein [Halanaerobium congolense]|uniref:ATP-binding cassette domain-containing protein n=1 Tax=Halanaerobium congolense TaxID=54121 RepID=UPI003CC6CE15